jgi:putative phosphoesterase
MSTRLAVISDVHADVHALRDALEIIDRLGIETVCCGDLIDYGLFPDETLSLLRERKIVSIRGNHDRWAIKDSHDMSGWDLTGDNLAYLASLPVSWSRAINGVRVVLAHARPESDIKGIAPNAPGWELTKLLDEAQADIMFVGHMHQPFIRRVGGRFVVNPGALLRNPAPDVEVATPGTFAILEIADGVPKVEIRRASSDEIVMQHR